MSKAGVPTDLPRTVATDDEQQHHLHRDALALSRGSERVAVRSSRAYVTYTGDGKGGANRSVVWLRRARGLSTFREPSEELPSTLPTFLFRGDDAFKR